MVVHEQVNQVRPHIVCAILRNIKFTETRYQSFIDLQEKLHGNICRKRSLVAIGVHNFDTIKGPFSYQARRPEEIEFVPLNQKRKMNGRELMEFYESDLHLRKYLPIIRESPVYPIIYDANGVVLSLPPIINGNHSKITLDTRNVLIDCTATSITKANIVLNTMLAMFSGYCEEPFTVEPMIVEQTDASENEYPEIEPRLMSAAVGYINQSIGVDLSVDDIIGHLSRMSVPARPGSTTSSQSPTIDVLVPPQDPTCCTPATLLRTWLLLSATTTSQGA